jgi:hypothetical protein
MFIGLSNLRLAITVPAKIYISHHRQSNSRKDSHFSTIGAESSRKDLYSRPLSSWIGLTERGIYEILKKSFL